MTTGNNSHYLLLINGNIVLDTGITQRKARDSRTGGMIGILRCSIIVQASHLAHILGQAEHLTCVTVFVVVPGVDDHTVPVI